jgi:hypothetical protein
MSETHKAVFVREWEETEDSGERYRLREFKALCGVVWNPATMEPLTHDNWRVNCEACRLKLPPPFLPVDATQRLIGMSVNDRLVLRDWFAGSEHYAELVTYIDKLNAETMRRYGAKEPTNG